VTKTAEVGDNSGAVRPEQLRGLVERAEKLLEEKAEIAEDFKQLMAEAKGAGYDTKMIKRVIKLRAMDTEQRLEEAMLLLIYSKALGIE
jgi:uncharacterized protein (UPF0335 family)